MERLELLKMKIVAIARSNKKLLLCIAIFSPLLVFIFRFCTNQVSDSPDDWLTLFDVFVNYMSLCVLIFFSYLVYKYNEDRDSINDRPILVFRTYDDKGEKGWLIDNIGNGNAINLRIGYKRSGQSDWDSSVVDDYALIHGGTLKIDWDLQLPNLICAVYEDIHGKRYVSLIKDYKSVFYELDATQGFHVSNIALTKDDILKINEISSTPLNLKYSVSRQITPTGTTSSTTMIITTSKDG